MKSMLNAILRGLMRRSDAVGEVRTGTKLVDAVPPKTSVIVSSVTVPAGTYVVFGNVAYNVSEEVLTICSIATPERQVAVVRGTMGAGGGDCASCVVTMTESTEIRLRAYHAASHATPIAIADLNVVRIK